MTSGRHTFQILRTGSSTWNYRVDSSIVVRTHGPRMGWRYRPAWSRPQTSSRSSRGIARGAGHGAGTGVARRCRRERAAWPRPRGHRSRPPRLPARLPRGAARGGQLVGVLRSTPAAFVASRTLPLARITSRKRRRQSGRRRRGVTGYAQARRTALRPVNASWPGRSSRSALLWLASGNPAGAAECHGAGLRVTLGGEPRGLRYEQVGDHQVGREREHGDEQRHQEVDRVGQRVGRPHQLRHPGVADPEFRR